MAGQPQRLCQQPAAERADIIHNVLLRLHRVFDKFGQRPDADPRPCVARSQYVEVVRSTFCNRAALRRMSLQFLLEWNSGIYQTPVNKTICVLESQSMNLL